MTLTDARSSPRRPLSDPDVSHDWTPQIDEHGMTRGYYCPDCLIAGAPVVAPCPDRVGWLQRRLAVVEGERDGARARVRELEAVLDAIARSTNRAAGPARTMRRAATRPTRCGACWRATGS